MCADRAGGCLKGGLPHADLHSNEFGLNFGGGVHVFFTDTIGLRGDVRYFRALLNEGEELGEQLLDDELGLHDYDFWRATFGVTLRFGR